MRPSHARFSRTSVVPAPTCSCPATPPHRRRRRRRRVSHAGMDVFFSPAPTRRGTAAAAAKPGPGREGGGLDLMNGDVTRLGPGHVTASLIRGRDPPRSYGDVTRLAHTGT